MQEEEEEEIKEEEELTLVLQVASLLRLLVRFPLVLGGSVLQHQLVLLQLGHTSLHSLPRITLMKDGNGEEQSRL